MKRLCVLVLFSVLMLFSSTAHATLVERMMGWPGFTKIAVHAFYAINHERIEGAQTRQNVIDALGLAGTDITEYDALVALAPTGSTALNIAQKAMYLSKIHAIFLLGELRMPGYDTPTLVRAKLGL
jgi:hypothetical protein